MNAKTYLVLAVAAVACSGCVANANADLFPGEATQMPIPPNSNYADYSPNISSDNLELYFASTRPGPFGIYSTWVARRESPSDPFGVPEAVTSLNHPSISHDGLSLYGNLSTGSAGQDLYVITRPEADATWSTPVDLGSSINTVQHERGCSITADGLELYFNRGWDSPASSNAIWVAERSDPSEPFAEPVKLSAVVNGPTGAWAPEISDDGLTLVFAAERPGGLGLDDFWVSTRPTRDNEWSEPVHLGSTVNSPLWDDTTDISPDGRVLYFARSATTNDGGDWNLWQARLFLPGEHFTTTQFPNAIYTVADTGNNPAFDNQGDSADSKASAPASAVGERDTTDGNAIVRLVAKFALPQMPEVDRRLEKATLRLFLEDIAGTPAGPVSLFHSVDDNDLDELPTDYEDGSYTDSLLDLVQPANAGQTYYELDVTDLVRADYAADGGDLMSAFRLQVNEAVFVEDDQSHRYRFAMPGAAAGHPELVLTFIPEPSTLFLCIIALGIVGGWRKWHRGEAMGRLPTTTGCLLGLLLLAVTVSPAEGQILIDDFNDGDDEGWLRVDDFAGVAGPGIYDASAGEYNLMATGFAPGADGFVSSYWDLSSDPLYSNGYLRATVKANTQGTSVGLALRADTSFQNGYYFTAQTDGGWINLWKLHNGEFIFVDDFSIPFAPGEEWTIEAGAVGDLLSVKAWRGEDEPADPQLEHRDATLTTGRFGVEVHNGSGNLIKPDGVFDDIYFTPVPEPSTLFLCTIALGIVAGWRKWSG